MPLGHEYFFGPTPQATRDGFSPSVRIRLKAIRVPPIQDAAVLGRAAPISRTVMMKTLRLLSPEPYVGIPVEGDDKVGAILVRKGVLKRVGWAPLKRMVLNSIKPLMAASEIVTLRLEVEVSVGEAY